MAQEHHTEVQAPVAVQNRHAEVQDLIAAQDHPPVLVAKVRNYSLYDLCFKNFP